MATRTKEQEKTFLNSSFYSPESRSLTLAGPLKYREGVAGFLVLAHELEHAIVDHVHLERYGKSASISLWNLRRPDLKFHDELSAMRAEWNFISSVPEVFRRELVLEMKNDSTLAPDLKKFWIRILENASMNRENYIHSEHAAGRYSRAQLYGENFMMKSLGVTLLSTIGFMSGVLASTAYCIYKVRDPLFDRKTRWFQGICTPNTFVQEEIKKIETTSKRRIPVDEDDPLLNTLR